MTRALLLLPMLVLSAPLAAQSIDSAAFIIRLGTDTTAVERYVRTDRELVAEAVSRSPSTMLHRLTIHFDDAGRAVHAIYALQRPGTDTEARRVDITFTGDSARMETVMGSNSRTQTVAAGNAIPMALKITVTTVISIRPMTAATPMNAATSQMRLRIVSNDFISGSE